MLELKYKSEHKIEEKYFNAVILMHSSEDLQEHYFSLSEKQIGITVIVLIQTT